MTVKPKYYKRLEYDLFNYKAFKESIRTLEKDLEEFDRIDGVNGIAYDGIKIGKTFKFASSVEDTALSNVEKLDYIRHCMRRTKDTIDNIERALEVLNDEERSIIQLRYLEGCQWYNIAYKVKYNERWCREIRRRAMYKMAICIYGDTAVTEPF